MHPRPGGRQREIVAILDDLIATAQERRNPPPGENKPPLDVPTGDDPRGAVKSVLPPPGTSMMLLRASQLSLLVDKRIIVVLAGFQETMVLL